MKPAHWLLLPPLLGLIGCFGNSTTTVVDPATWVKNDIAVEDVSISLGHFDHEPVARVSRGGNAAADIMVFCGIVESEGDDVVGDEVATVYDRDTELYVADGLDLSAGSGGGIVRFRVVLPGQNEPWIGHMPAP